jgi:hypothetical protein
VKIGFYVQNLKNNPHVRKVAFFWEYILQVISAIKQNLEFVLISKSKYFSRCDNLPPKIIDLLMSGHNVTKIYLLF